MDGKASFPAPEADPDHSALRRWARGYCRHQTVEGLAGAFHVAPEIDTVLACVSGDLEGERAAVVQEACRIELQRTAQSTTEETAEPQSG